MAPRTPSTVSGHISVIDGQPTTTTQDIAEVYGKQHAKVLAIVRQRMAEAGEWGVANFGETPYTNPQNGQTYPVIRMTKKGFHFVVGKFTGSKAVQHQIAFADAFERMEADLAQAKHVPALPAPANHRADMFSMLGLASTTGQFVQQTVFAALLDEAGQEGWRHGRWLLSFRNTANGPVPVVREVPQDAHVLNLDGLIQAVAEPEFFFNRQTGMVRLLDALFQQAATHRAPDLPTYTAPDLPNLPDELRTEFELHVWRLLHPARQAVAHWLAQRLKQRVTPGALRTPAEATAFVRKVLAEQTYENWISDGEMAHLLAMMQTWEAMAGMAKEGFEDIKARTQALSKLGGVSALPTA